MRESGELGNGETIAAVSAILLFASTFFHWFGVKAVNTSNLLFAIQSVEPGKSAWEALDYIPVVLVVTIVAALALAGLRLSSAVRGPAVAMDAVVAILGVVSVVLILYRIADPPVFRVETTITSEGAAQWPIYFALFAAAGIACGGCMGMREEARSRRRGG